jgi:hypothetical protein
MPELNVKQRASFDGSVILFSFRNIPKIPQVPGMKRA